MKAIQLLIRCCLLSNGVITLPSFQIYMTAFKCVGNHEEAIKCIDKIVNMMSECEIYIERYYDHYMFSGILELYTEGMRGKVFSNMNL